MNQIISMRSVALWFLVIVAVALATLWAVRQRTLNDLRAANEVLRNQLQAASPTQPSQIPSDNPPSQSGQDDHLELLRLRGQIQSLRREANDLSNRVTRLAPNGSR